MADIIIIGGGVSGLTAGIYAQMNGHRAVIYERHAKAGGNLTGWDRGGYHIDNCIHWLTGTNPHTKMYEKWKELGVLGDTEVYQPETLYTFQKDGKSISLNKSLRQLEEDMLKLAPEDEGEIRSLVRAIDAIRFLNGTAGEANDEKGTVWQKLLSAPILLKYRRLTTGELAARFSNPVLRGFIGSVLTEYFGSIALVMMFATFCGGNGGIPAGSSCAMAERMAERFLSLGGRLYRGKGVERINVRGNTAGSVTLEDGTTAAGDYIVIAADPAAAFGRLLDKRFMPAGLKKRYGDPRLQRFSSYHCAFACDAGEPPFRSDVVFEVPEEYRKKLRTDHLLVREFSHEKSFAPEGKSILQAMAYCTEEEARGFIELSRDKTAYRERKRRIAADVEELILRQFPELRGKLRCIDVWTPATYRRYVDSEIGSYMGFAFSSGILPQTLGCRVRGLKNVVLATQWLQAPGGLPIAAKEGAAAIETIMRMEKRASGVFRRGGERVTETVRAAGAVGAAGSQQGSPAAE